MSAGWIERILLVLGMTGCDRIVTEPPPPPSRYEVTVAPPGARGARAAGTEAASKPPILAAPGRSPDSVAPDAEDESLAPDAGALNAEKGVPL